MGEIVNQILSHGGPVAAVVAVFALANLGSLYLVLRWADRKQQRLIGSFRRHSRRLVAAFATAQAKHDEHLAALVLRVERVEDAALVLTDEMRKRWRPNYQHIPEQRSP